MEVTGNHKPMVISLKRQLTVNQRYVLQQINAMNGQGYLCSLRKQIKEITGKDISLGRMSDLLDKMERRGWVQGCYGHIEMKWKQGNKSAEGERWVKMYALLPVGEKLLKTR